MLRSALIAAALAAACPAAAADLNRIVLNGSDEALGVNAVADEGEGEPRSTGSYPLRPYKAGDPAFPFHPLLSGAVRPRSGSLQPPQFSVLDRRCAAYVKLTGAWGRPGPFLAPTGAKGGERELRGGWLEDVGRGGRVDRGQ